MIKYSEKSLKKRNLEPKCYKDHLTKKKRLRNKNDVHV